MESIKTSYSKEFLEQQLPGIRLFCFGDLQMKFWRGHTSLVVFEPHTNSLRSYHATCMRLGKPVTLTKILQTDRLHLKRCSSVFLMWGSGFPAVLYC